MSTKSQETKRYQNELAKALGNIFDDVKIEWNVAKDSGDDLNRTLYCPRVDIGVGPFHIRRDYHDYNKLHDAPQIHDVFIRELLKKVNNPREFRLNENPRCFLAIEIEASGSRKHMFGDIANASILGKVGIIITLEDKKYADFIKIKKYVDFAVEHGKTRDIFNNVIIIKKNDFNNVLEIYAKFLNKRKKELMPRQVLN